MIGDQPTISCRNLVSAANLRCCTQTLSRKLKQEGISHQRALKRPHLMQSAAGLRLAFVQYCLNKGRAGFQERVFSIEVSAEKTAGDVGSWVFWSAQIGPY